MTEVAPRSGRWRSARRIVVVLLVFVIPMLEGWSIASRIQGALIDFSASATLIFLAVGGALAGGLGMLPSLPAAAAIRALVVYVTRRLSGATPAEAMVGLIPSERRRQRAEAAAQTESVGAPAPAEPAG